MRGGTFGTATYAHLVNPKRNWYNNKRIIILNFWILLLLLTSSTSSYNAGIMGSFQVLPQWKGYFQNPTVRTLNLFNTIQVAGALFALPICPYAADNLGRRASIFVGAIIMCMATAGQTAADSMVMFICARFLMGFGLAFAAIAAPILAAEIAYPAHRAPLTSAYGSLWYSGAIAAAWSTFGAAKMQSNWSWRLPSVLQSIPLALQVALIWFAPESPRWLISKNRDAEALKTLAYYHADSDEDDPLVMFEYDEIKAAIECEVAAKIGWKTLHATPGYKKRVKVLFVLAFALPWYAYPLEAALATISNTGSNILVLSNVLQVWNFFWALLAASLVDKVGRRTLFLTSIAGTVVFFSLLTACSTAYTKNGDQAAARAFIAFLFLFYSFFNLAFPTLLVSYPIEIFPYSLRAKGFTLYYFATILSYIVNQYVRLPVGLGPFYWNIFLVVLIASQGPILWYFIIETKNRTLEETGILFDGDDSIEPVLLPTSNSTHNSKEDEKPSQTFIT